MHVGLSSALPKHACWLPRGRCSSCVPLYRDVATSLADALWTGPHCPAAASPLELSGSQLLCTAQVFSWFEYMNSCDGRKERIPIEPLVGALRHPFTIPACHPQVGIAVVLKTRTRKNEKSRFAHARWPCTGAEVLSLMERRCAPSLMFAQLRHHCCIMHMRDLLWSSVAECH